LDEEKKATDAVVFAIKKRLHVFCADICQKIKSNQYVQALERKVKAAIKYAIKELYVHCASACQKLKSSANAETR
jgi:ribosomal silencing factor RsfS